MKLKSMFCSAIVASLSLFASASSAQDVASPKGTICFTYNIRDIAKVPFTCTGLGKFASINELYERGYRVVSSTVLQESTVNTLIFFIEKRD